MTCHDFTGALHEYLDDTLDRRRSAALREHLHACAACQRALHQEQAVARALQPALEQAAAEISFQPELSYRIVRAARESLRPKPAPVRLWHSLAAHPWRALAAGLAAAAMVGFALQSRRERAPAAREFISFSLDVPFQIDGQPGISHVEFYQASAD